MYVRASSYTNHWKQVETTKSPTHKDYTLMRYLVDTLRRTRPHLLKWGDEMPHLEKANRDFVTQAISEYQTLRYFATLEGSFLNRCASFLIWSHCSHTPCVFNHVSFCGCFSRVLYSWKLASVDCIV